MPLPIIWTIVGAKLIIEAFNSNKNTRKESDDPHTLMQALLPTTNREKSCGIDVDQFALQDQMLEQIDAICVAHPDLQSQLEKSSNLALPVSHIMDYLRAKQSSLEELGRRSQNEVAAFLQGLTRPAEQQCQRPISHSGESTVFGEYHNEAGDQSNALGNKYNPRKAAKGNVNNTSQIMDGFATLLGNDQLRVVSSRIDVATGLSTAFGELGTRAISEVNKIRVPKSQSNMHDRFVPVVSNPQATAASPLDRPPAGRAPQILTKSPIAQAHTMPLMPNSPSPQKCPSPQVPPKPEFLQSRPHITMIDLESPTVSEPSTRAPLPRLFTEAGWALNDPTELSVTERRRFFEGDPLFPIHSA